MAEPTAPKFSEGKVYELVNVIVEDPIAFNSWWVKGSLPHWLEHGAKHIGSYINFAGGSNKEIIRLFEFENMAAYMKWIDWLLSSPEGAKLMEELGRFNINAQRRLVVDAPII